MQKLLRTPDVRAHTGLSRSTIHNRIHDGTFTRPVSLGDRAVAWPADEIEALNAARIAGASNDDVRALVQRLYAARNPDGKAPAMLPRGPKCKSPGKYGGRPRKTAASQPRIARKGAAANDL